MVIAANRTSLQEYLTSEGMGQGHNSGLGAVIMAIAEGSCQIQQQVRQAALADNLGTTGETNVQNEIVQRLDRSEEHTSELQSLAYLVCRLLLEKKNK